MPDLYVVVGPNGSGKSSAIIGFGLNERCSIIINPDNFARRIVDISDETERYIMAMRECEGLREELLRMGTSFGFETVGSRDDKLDFMRRAKGLGYRIYLVFVSTSDPDINVSRIGERVRRGGHGVPEEKIRARYTRTMSRLPEYLALSDEAVVLDNSGKRPIQVLTKIDGMIWIAEDAPGWIKVCIPSDGTD